MSALGGIDALMHAGVLRPLDRHLAASLARAGGGDDSSLVLLAAALASRAVQRGHVCVDLERLAEAPWLATETGVDVALDLPPLEEWVALLQDSGLVTTVDVGADVGERRPLVLEEGQRLYLFRYWRYQARLVAGLRPRMARMARIDERLLTLGLDRLFATDGAGERTQRAAARLAVERPFAVISGGPGTGKTTTVVKVLALLQEQARAAGGEWLRIHLVAPTGKAAQRLSESIRGQLERLDADADVRRAIPHQASTIHRALGYLPGQPTRFRHDAARPLPTDAVVCDEASMVDIALMAKLVDAVPKNARLLLLGDKDQLASVEAGAILGDLCSGGLGDSVAELTHSFRYRDSGAIGRLASAINRADAGAVVDELGRGDEAVEWLADAGEAALRDWLRALATRGFAALAERDPEELLRALERFRVLCVHRSGERGVDATNALIEAELAAAGVVDATSEWYPGRPVLITRNDYQLQLFNGDAGVVAPDESGRLKAWFRGEQGELRGVLPARLPPHETVYAMTVHKSQGSEFDEVALLLPERPSPVLTRELIYTGVTRARAVVRIAGTEQVLRDAVPRHIERASGLRAALK